MFSALIKENVILSNRVCFVSPAFHPAWKGVGRSAVRITKALSARGYMFDVVVPEYLKQGDRTPDQYGEFHKAIAAPEKLTENIRIFRPRINRDNKVMAHLGDFIQLLDYLNDYEMFHGFWLPLAYPCLSVAARNNRPVIASIRGNDAVQVLSNVTQLPYIQAVLEGASWVTSVSSDLLDRVRTINSSIGDRSSVIQNCIDLSDAQELPKWNADAVEVGHFGTVAEIRFKKAIPDLVRAYGSIEKINRNRLTLIGPVEDEYELERIKQACYESGTIDEVVFEGYLERKKMLEMISKLNAFIICSYHDGLPNTLLEASLMGVPLICSSVGGMRDILVHEKNALLVNPGRVEELAKAMKALRTSYSLRESISAGVIQLSRENTVEHEGDRWSTLYHNVLNR